MWKAHESTRWRTKRFSYGTAPILARLKVLAELVEWSFWRAWQLHTQ
jgi:hypothetical protein